MALYPLNHGPALIEPTGAIAFDAVDGDAYEMNDADFRNFPNSPWALWIWTRVEDNAGDFFQYVLSKGNIVAANSINVFLYEDSQVLSDRWQCRMVAGAGTTEVDLFPTDAPGADGVDRLILVQRTDTQFEMWWCEANQSPALKASQAITNQVALTSALSFFCGKRNDNNPDRFYGNIAGGWGRANSALTERQIKNLGAGASPLAIGIKNLIGYIPMTEPGTTIPNIVNPNAPATAVRIGDPATGFPYNINPLLVGVGSAPLVVPEGPTPPPPADPEVVAEGTNVTELTLGSWDDSTGTALIDDGAGTRRAIAWTPTTYVVVNNGVVMENGEWPIATPTCPQTGGGTTYYVSESKGSDANDGLSMLTPKRTNSFVNGTVVAGDTVLFRRGDTFPAGQFFPNVTGAATDYIRFGAYQDTDGTDDPRPIFDDTARQGDSGGKYILYTGGTNDYLWFEDLDWTSGKGNAPTGTIGMVYALGNYNFFVRCVMRESIGSGADIVGFGSEIHECEILDNNLNGIRCTRAATPSPSGRTVANCTFLRNAAGTDPTNPSGSEPLTLMDTDARCYGNTFRDNRGTDHLAYLTWINETEDEWIGKALVWRNTFDCTAKNAVSFGPVGTKGRGGRVVANTILTATQRGLELQLPADQGAGTPRGEAYIHHNVVVDVQPYGPWPGGFALELTALRFADPNGEGGLYAHNNTFHDCKKGMRLDNTEMAGVVDSQFYLRNNLLSDIDGPNVDLAYITGLDIDIDYNYYAKTTGTPFNRLGTDMDIATWRTVYGFDTNSSGGDAILHVDDTNPVLTERNYGLQSGSPARSGNGDFTGTDEVFLVDTDILSWIGINMVPHATSPDAGAYQYLTGKTLDFSKYFLGIKAVTAAEAKIWNVAKSKAELITLTT